MLLEEFNALNLKQGDKIKVTYDKLLSDHNGWRQKETTHKWLVTEIKEAVLSPTKTELCLYDYDGGFLPISKIKQITIMKNSKYCPVENSDFSFDKAIM